MNYWSSFLVVFMAQFVAIDIIGVVPLYLSMTKDLNRQERNHIIGISVWVAGVVALVFTFLGRTIFKHLGIALFDFRIAGGLVLLLVSLADLLNGPQRVNQASGSTGIVPLAVPLITGPALLTTLVIHVGTYGYPVTLLSLVLNFLFVWVALRNSDKVTALIGKDGTVAISKIAALLLAAMAIAMIRSGIIQAFYEATKHP